MQIGDVYLCNTSNIDTIKNKYSNPSSFNNINYNLSKKIYYEVSLDSCVRQKHNHNFFTTLQSLRNRLISKNNKNYSNSSFINALALGEKDFSEQETNYLRSGSLMHLVTISGMHIILIISFFNFIFFKLNLSNQTSSFIIVILLLIYYVLAGSSIALTRAILLYILRLIFNKTSTLDLLCYIALFLLFINPFIVLDIGFILTFFISFIIIFSSNFKSFKTLKLSILIQLLTFPILINLNYEFNFISLINIIIFTPLLSYIYLPLSFYATFFNDPLNIVDTLFGILSHLLQLTYIKPIVLGHFENIFIILFYFLVFISLKYNRYLLILLILLYSISFNININISTIHFIDINQGKSIIITFKNKDVLVIDSGSEKHSDELVNYLKYIGVSTITHYVITHNHEDHYGGTANLNANFKILNIYSSYSYKQLSSGDTLYIGGYSFKVLSPIVYDENPNNMSIVLYANLNNLKLLLTGDIEKDVENLILNKYSNLDVDILDVAHHGSSTSSDSEFISTLSPEYAIIQYGIKNKYGHPNSETISTLNDNNVKILSPSIDGVIKFDF